MDRNRFVTRFETPQDEQAIGKINQEAFGGDIEANLIKALREGGFVEVSLVAEINKELVGHLLFSRITIQSAQRSIEALSLAPMAVRPKFQRQGIGSQLVEAGLKACRELNWEIVLVLGHPEFYPRFGFLPELAQTLESPFGGGESWMALELTPGALAGVEGTVIYSPPFSMFE